MSAYATTWAWTVDGVNDRQRLALLALADNANDDGVIRTSPHDPSLDETLTRCLSTRLRLDQDQAGAVLADLYDAGLADVVRSGATRCLQLAITQHHRAPEAAS